MPVNSSELARMIFNALSDGYDDEENREETEKVLYNELSQLYGDSAIRIALQRLCERVEELEEDADLFMEREDKPMKKLFKVTYKETYIKEYVIEAESQEDAWQKANSLAEECEIPIDNADDFDHWDLEVGKEMAEDEASYYDRLEPEE